MKVGGLKTFPYDSVMIVRVIPINGRAASEKLSIDNVAVTDSPAVERLKLSPQIRKVLVSCSIFKSLHVLHVWVSRSYRLQDMQHRASAEVLSEGNRYYAGQMNHLTMNQPRRGQRGTFLQLVQLGG